MRKNQQEGNQHKTTKPGTGNKSPAVAKKRAPKKVKETVPPPLTEQIPADNPNPPATPNKMEVHHHPQLEHKHKPWKEYLLEGFMIFIAVMMGFIAENVRESITNREHARQLTIQLIQDLKSDTAALNQAYRGETRIFNSDDSLITLLQKPLAKADLGKIQKHIGISHSLWPFHPSMGAITAIKNDLHLKQFSESEIIRYISRYEGHVDLIHTVQNITLEFQRNYYDPFLIKHFTPVNLQATFDRKSFTQIGMRNLTQDDLTQLAAQLVLIRINTKELLNDNRMLVEDAVDMLNYVKQKFDLDDNR